MSPGELPFRFLEDPHSLRDASALVVRVPRRARGKEKLLSVLAKPLRFPHYFGWNWDALEECLGDLSWLSGIKRIVIVHEALPFSPHGDQLPIYLSILAGTLNRRAADEIIPKLDVIFPEQARTAVIAALRMT